MASAWTATARLALHHYGAPALAAGGFLAAATSSSLNPFRIDSSGTLSTTTCEAATTQQKVTLKDGAAASMPTTASYRRRMSNVGRFSLLSETESNPSIPVLVMSLSGKAWTAKDFTQLYHDRKIDERHERFRSVLDPKDSHHFLALDIPSSEESKKTTTTGEYPRPLPVQDMLTYPRIYRSELKSMISDAILQPINLNKSLWQAWTATGGALGQSGATSKAQAANTAKEDPSAVESLLLFRAHHCLADGVSLGAIFGELMDEGEEISNLIKAKVQEFKRRKKSLWRRIQVFFYYWCWGSVRALWYQFWLYVRSLFAPNPWKVLKKAAALQDDTVSTEARTISWVQIASVDEVKKVADYFSQKTRGKVTVNDIFCSCVSGAIAKLMRYHRQVHPELPLELPMMNLVIPVHMQGGVLLPGQSMGNKIGALVSRVPAEAADNAADRLYEVHNTLWDRKQTPAAVLAFLAAKMFGGMLGTVLGSWTPWVFETAHANASVVVTNVRGPETMMHLKGRRVETNLGFLPLPPGIPIGMVVMSYNQKLTLTIMAERWAVPDADMFLTWVAEEYQELLNQAKVDSKAVAAQ